MAAKVSGFHLLSAPKLWTPGLETCLFHFFGLTNGTLSSWHVTTFLSPNADFLDEWNAPCLQLGMDAKCRSSAPPLFKDLKLLSARTQKTCGHGLTI